MDNRKNSNVRKFPIRKRITTDNQKLKDPLINTDTSFQSYDFFANKYCSSSKWKLTSASDDSTFQITKRHTSAVLKKDTRTKHGKSNEHSTLNKQYPAQMYKYISNQNKQIQKMNERTIPRIAVGTTKIPHEAPETKIIVYPNKNYYVRRQTRI